ncbi:hypothetical protein CKAH01_04150 [Colletotrichum kahawae]|uniref:Uncharacterized protein n=1 Tax=Colletotrichum kahawae TaxID=34407 RepID=A0AAE0D9W5_COLKA|nr:hypothetical protein CKAH01_04150 [Colletotrichum kahawae]
MLSFHTGPRPPEKKLVWILRTGGPSSKIYPEKLHQDGKLIWWDGGYDRARLQQLQKRNEVFIKSLQRKRGSALLEDKHNQQYLLANGGKEMLSREIIGVLQVALDGNDQPLGQGQDREPWSGRQEATGSHRKPKRAASNMAL